MDYDKVLNNEKLPLNVRYAMLREEIKQKAKNREEKRTLLMMVGHNLGGTLHKGKTVIEIINGKKQEKTLPFWQFPDNTKGKFQ